jgi:hypothetical protein
VIFRSDYVLEKVQVYGSAGRQGESGQAAEGQDVSLNRLWFRLALIAVVFVIWCISAMIRQ